MKHSPMSIVLIVFMLSAMFWGAFTGTLEAVTQSSFDSAKSAVTLAIGLIGVMAFWLGMMKILEVGGLMKALARLLRPVMCRLFPQVPSEHPAMSSMIMNITSNMLGLGNAATPFGIKAMQQLERLNPCPGQATNAMCLFLAINTSSVTLLPLGAIGVRAAAGSHEPAAILLPTMLATFCSSTVAVLLALLLSRKEQVKEDKDPEFEKIAEEIDTTRSALLPVAAVLTVFGVAFFYRGLHQNSLVEITNELSSYWLMPVLMSLILVYGFAKRVPLYETVTEGAKQGFEIAVKIIPYLVVILVAIGMFRASGALTALESMFQPIGSVIGLPASVLPLAILRPLSGSGAFAVMGAIVAEEPNSYEAFLASTMMGSTETTFYVLAVYFGAAGVTKIKHTLVCALSADIVGILAACYFSQLFWAG